MDSRMNNVALQVTYLLGLLVVPPCYRTWHLSTPHSDHLLTLSCFPPWTAWSPSGEAHFNQFVAECFKLQRASDVTLQRAHRKTFPPHDCKGSPHCNSESHDLWISQYVHILGTAMPTEVCCGTETWWKCGIRNLNWSDGKTWGEVWGEDFFTCQPNIRDLGANFRHLVSSFAPFFLKDFAQADSRGAMLAHLDRIALLIVGVSRGNTTRGNRTRNSERKMALLRGAPRGSLRGHRETSEVHSVTNSPVQGVLSEVAGVPSETLSETLLKSSQNPGYDIDVIAGAENQCVGSLVGPTAQRFAFHASPRNLGCKRQPKSSWTIVPVPIEQPPLTARQSEDTGDKTWGHWDLTAIASWANLTSATCRQRKTRHGSIQNTSLATHKSLSSRIGSKDQGEEANWRQADALTKFLGLNLDIEHQSGTDANETSHMIIFWGLWVSGSNQTRAIWWKRPNAG